MTIEGDYADFAHLETVYLGVMARRTLIMRNVREVVEAARGKPILYFPARHDHWLVQTGDGWSAHIGGRDRRLDRRAGLVVGRPRRRHRAARADRRLRRGHGAGRAQVRRPLRARHERHRARRLRQRLGARPRSRSPRRSATTSGACGWTPPTSSPTSRCAACTATPRRPAWPPSWSSSCAPSSTRRGYPDVHIVVSGGFTAERIRAFEARGRARGLLRRRLLADPRLQRLHRRRRDERRQAVREGRARVPPEPAPGAASAS